jgi:hypothetical protein
LDEGKEPKVLVLDREDVLELRLLGETQRRIKAEEARLQAELNASQAESNALTARLAQKYKLDFDGLRVEGDGRVLRQDGTLVKVPE